jgi:predicted RNA binding protein YcfA (HicA-like mRNA interferase family)
LYIILLNVILQMWKICARCGDAPQVKEPLELNRQKVAAPLEREGWNVRHGRAHDIYEHPERPGRAIVVPRHRTLTPGVARSIAKIAEWR